jgi:hypothetical protein
MTFSRFFPSFEQGCQMVCFQTKNPNLGKFWMALEWKMQVYFMVIWNILQSFGIFYEKFGKCCGNLVYFPSFWYIVSRKIWQPWFRRFFSPILITIEHSRLEHVD